MLSRPFVHSSNIAKLIFVLIVVAPLRTSASYNHETTRGVVAAAKQVDTSASTRTSQHHYDRLSSRVSADTAAYKMYPPYCSKPDVMTQRRIPPLSANDTSFGASRLVHVTGIIRHGARTPYKASLPCWKGYNAFDYNWDCNYTTLMAAVTPASSSSLASGNPAKPASASAAPPLLLFEKKYDALPFPQYNLLNDLGGNCITGQLLTEGYKQEMTNGQLLRNAYVFDSKSKTNQHDPRMSLLDVADTDTNDAALWQSLYYRAGDDQRTLVSGQALLQGMLGPELEKHVRQNNGQYPRIPLHTVDYARDILYPNEVLCPRLAEMRERFEKTRDYLLFNESQEVKTLRHFQQAVLGTDQDMSMDCLMNTICTDRPLPDAINDYIGGDEHNVPNMRVPHNDTDYGTNLFLRLYNFYVRQYTISIMANDAEYAKLAMGPLWAEIVDNIQAVVQEQHTVPNSIPPRPVPKLALFSGQDTTLIPLLASLHGVYDERWPPYASMLLIEIHEINLDGRKTGPLFTSDFAFRLIYNGQVITRFFCGGHRDMCDVQSLLYSVSKFAIRQRDDQCSRQSVAPQVYVNAVPEATQRLSSSGGWSLLMLIIIISATVGSAMTFWYLVYHHPAGRTVDWREGRDNHCPFLLERFQRHKYQAAPIVDDDGIALMRLDLAVHYRDGEDEKEVE